MGDKWKKVSAGSPVSISAPTWNGILDAGKAHEESRRQNMAGGQATIVPQSGQVLVQNDTGAAVSMYHVLGIDTGLAITASGATGERQSNIILKGIVPTAGSVGKFVITSSPIAAGAIGLAWVAGVCAVQVNVISEATGTDNNYADVLATDTKQLEINTKGAAQILTRNSGTGTVWAVVRIGGTAGASGNVPAASGPDQFLYSPSSGPGWTVTDFSTEVSSIVTPLIPSVPLASTVTPQPVFLSENFVTGTSAGDSVAWSRGNHEHHLQNVGGSHHYKGIYVDSLGELVLDFLRAV